MAILFYCFIDIQCTLFAFYIDVHRYGIWIMNNKEKNHCLLIRYWGRNKIKIDVKSNIKIKAPSELDTAILPTDALASSCSFPW